MRVDVTVETVVPAPIETVSEFAGNPSNAPRWYARINSVEWRTPPPTTLGSRMDFTARFLGRRLAYTYVVVEHEPGRRLVMRTDSGPFPMETTYTWEAVVGGTRMTLTNRGEPAGFGALATPVMSWAMRRAMTQDLARLTSVLTRPTRR